MRRFGFLVKLPIKLRLLSNTPNSSLLDSSHVLKMFCTTNSINPSNKLSYCSWLECSLYKISEIQ